MDGAAVSENSPLSLSAADRESARTSIFRSIESALTKSPESAFAPLQGFGSVQDLIPRLFRRAPLTWLSQSTPEALADAACKTFATLAEWWSARTTARSDPNRTGPAVIVRALQELKTSSSHTTTSSRDILVIALLDRPFIINTIRSTLAANGRSCVTFVHPILSISSESVSLSYIELAPDDADTKDRTTRLHSLIADLNARLEHLTTITDDFSSMRHAVETCRETLLSTSDTHAESTHHEECASFLSWLLADRFVFEGVRVYSTTHSPTSRALGIFRGKDHLSEALTAETSQDGARLLADKTQLQVSLSAFRSPIHHAHRLCSIHVQIPQPASAQSTAAQAEPLLLCVIGQLTSRAVTEESSSIPLMQGRVRAALQHEGLRPSSHLYKAALTIVDGMPKHLLFLSHERSIQEHIHFILEAEQQGVHVAGVQRDQSGRVIWGFVALPSAHYSNQTRSAVVRAFEAGLGLSAGSSDHFVTSLDEAICRIYMLAPSRAGAKVNFQSLEGELVKQSKGWIHAFEDALTTYAPQSAPSQNGGKNAPSPKDLSARATRFRHAFSEDYQAFHSPEQAAEDAAIVESLLAHDAKPIAVRLNVSPEHAQEPTAELTISLYCRGKDIILSKSLPVLEHAGFDILNERSSIVRPADAPEVYLHRFPVRLKGSNTPQKLDATRRQIIADGLESVFLGQSEDDALNALMTSAGLSVSALSLLRAYCLLLWQVRKFATRQTIREALVHNPNLALQFWDIANLKFNPALSLSLPERSARVESSLAEFREGLRAISDITSDRILRSLLLLLQHTVRTNFYRNANNGSLPGPRPGVVALKIHSEHLELLSLPRPLFEIFISAPSFEGVHLRGARVARGGIRWSDRREDFRTEVRDLMRTQQVKNAIIVPSGAKGGFVVKELPTERGAQAEVVKECYQEFIRSLLSITDNRINNAVVPPEGVICYDEPDPYLVVAADKGTATFSDVANKIAVEEFNFWLGDAFASGGSNGYDHKKLGITAKGAWEAAKQHFKDARINFEQEPFTVIGIGDMSGDVFGNGLLLSKNIKLIAAFNHKHIFIDPNPDPANSWTERKRLFDAPYSQWTDYNPKLLSKGALIVDRYSKEISLSIEARKALALADDTPQTLSGEQLISAILRAPADLLWNGGIGTYVKSRSEADADVGDSTNDAVRINADELRARIVSEGGNLGFTQRARIDFAERGGLINTDAIDNSGGVDTSDHEVNLKILFQSEMQKGSLSKDERNKILRELDSFVVDDVLSHNHGQAVLLTSSAKRGSKNLDYFSSLMTELVRRGYLHRTVHMLPTDDELVERARSGAGLFRPELAMCTAGVKLWMKDELLQSGLTKEEALQSFLFDYFPPPLRTRFASSIRSHPLTENIIATKVANELVETVGLTFLHRMCLSQAVEPAVVLRALLAARTILRTPERREVVQGYDTFEQHELFLRLRIEVSAALREATTWLLSNHVRDVQIEHVVEQYSPGITQLTEHATEMLSGELRQYVTARVTPYLQQNLPPPTAEVFAAAPLTPIFFEILWCAAQGTESARMPAVNSASISQAALVYCSLVDALGLYGILAAQREVSANSKWEFELRLNAFDEIRRGISTLAVKMIRANCTDRTLIDEALRKHPGMERMRSAVNALSESRPNVAMLCVFARQLRMFSA